MRRLVVLLIISLFTTIPCFSQNILNDSVYVMTAEELKYVNLIFAEHEHLTKKSEILEKEVNNLTETVTILDEINRKNAETINNQETTIKKLKKKNKIKNSIIVSSIIGYLTLLVVTL